jgi:hypothetical protein
MPCPSPSSLVKARLEYALKSFITFSGGAFSFDDDMHVIGPHTRTCEGSETSNRFQPRCEQTSGRVCIPSKAIAVHLITGLIHVAAFHSGAPWIGFIMKMCAVAGESDEVPSFHPLQSRPGVTAPSRLQLSMSRLSLPYNYA